MTKRIYIYIYNIYGHTHIIYTHIYNTHTQISTYIFISTHICSIKDTIFYVYLYFKYLPIYTENHEFILIAPTSSFQQQKIYFGFPLHICHFFLQNEKPNSFIHSIFTYLHSPRIYRECFRNFNPKH